MLASSLHHSEKFFSYSSYTNNHYTSTFRFLVSWLRMKNESKHSVHQSLDLNHFSYVIFQQSFHNIFLRKHRHFLFMDFKAVDSLLFKSSHLIRSISQARIVGPMGEEKWRRSFRIERLRWGFAGHVTISVKYLAVGQTARAKISFAVAHSSLVLDLVVVQSIDR